MLTIEHLDVLESIQAEQEQLDRMMVVVVTAASLPEREGAKLVFATAKKSKKRFSRLITIWVDGGYRGIDFMRWVMDTYRAYYRNRVTLR